MNELSSQIEKVVETCWRNIIPNVLRCSIKHQRFGLFLVLFMVLGCLSVCDYVYAEGSRSLYPSTYPGGGYRANLDFQPGNLYVGKVQRRGFMYAYAEAGEYILMGSRNRSATPPAGDIYVFNPQSFGITGNETIPATADFSCSGGSAAPGPHYFGAGTGLIDTRLKELAGPNSADNTVTVTNGFRPCAYMVPTTGIYGVLFSAGTGGGPNGIIDPPAVSNNSASAWDVTVRANATSVTDINGRLFTYAFIGFTGGNSRPVYSTHYYITSDGYRYQQDLRGMDPNGYALYANTLGFLDNGQPLFKDIRGNEAMVTSIPPGVTSQIAQYPIFFSDISPTGPNNTEVNRVLGALFIPLSPPTPTVSNVSFSGHSGGKTTTTGVGGTFYFTTTDTITYLIVVSLDGINFDPDNVNNAVLTGIAPTGTHAVVWNGKDQNNINFPSSATPYLFRVVGHNGDVHFPIIDAENNLGGGPTITRLNGNNPGDRTVFFDDRGYITSSGTPVGNLNGTLCPTGTPAAPSPPYSLNGVDSSTNYRLWQSGGNSNTDCSVTAGWGDAKGLNLWTYYSTPQQDENLIIDPIIVDVATSVNAPNSATAGSTVQGAFSFANNGNSSALGVTYDMSMTPGLGTVTFANLPVGVTASYNNATGAVTLSGLPTTLATGQTISGMTFSYTAPATGPVTVTTNIYTTSPEESYLANNSDIAVTGIGSTDVLTTVSVPATALAGSSVSGNFLFANYGANLASGVTYTATIGSSGNYPAAVTFTSLPSGVTASYNPANGQITFTGMPGTLASGQSLGFGFSYTAPSSGVVQVNTSIATISSDANPANNNANGTTTINPISDLSITKADNPDPVIAGQNLTYTITVNNAGPSDATNVVVTDTLPAGVAFVSTTGCTGDPNGVPTCNLGTINAGGNKQYTVTVTVNTGTTGQLTNNVSVISDTADPYNTNNTASQNTTVNTSADIEITKTADDMTPAVNDTVVFTLTVRNNGPSDATGVEVTDILPSVLSYVSDTSGGAYNATTGIWNIGTLTVGSSESIDITLTIEEPGRIVNIASITDTDVPDPDQTNNSSGLILNAGANEADLAVVKKVNNPTPGVTENIVFTITVTNNGPDNATGVTLTDILPAGLTYISDDSGGDYVPGTGIWTVGALNVDNSAALQITARVDNAGEIINTAGITTSDQTDPDRTNNESIAVINQDPSHPQIADLAVQKTVNLDTVNLNDTVIFTIVVRNNGPDDGHNVKISDVADAGLTNITTKGCAEDPNGVSPCSVGTITASSYALIEITAQVSVAGSQTNTASVLSLDETDPNPNNDSDAATVTVPISAALTIVKSATPSTYSAVGAVISYSYLVTNSGNVTLSGITVNDPKCNVAPAYQSGDTNTDSKL